MELGIKGPAFRYVLKISCLDPGLNIWTRMERLVPLESEICVCRHVSITNWPQSMEHTQSSSMSMYLCINDRDSWLLKSFATSALRDS